MQYIGTIVKELPSGGFKVCVWGKADDHIMDWAGCNFRRKTVSGQPMRGFKTEEQAIAWARERFPGGEKEARDYASWAGDGVHSGDYDETEITVDDVFKNS